MWPRHVEFSSNQVQTKKTAARLWDLWEFFTSNTFAKCAVSHTDIHWCCRSVPTLVGEFLLPSMKMIFLNFHVKLCSWWNFRLVIKYFFKETAGVVWARPRCLQTLETPLAHIQRTPEEQDTTQVKYSDFILADVTSQRVWWGSRRGALRVSPRGPIKELLLICCRPIVLCDLCRTNCWWVCEPVFFSPSLCLLFCWPISPPTSRQTRFLALGMGGGDTEALQWWSELLTNPPAPPPPPRVAAAPLSMFVFSTSHKKKINKSIDDKRIDIWRWSNQVFFEHLEKCVSRCEISISKLDVVKSIYRCKFFH